MDTIAAIVGNVFFTLIFVSFFIWLEILLSKRRNKWLGLILPAIYLILSLFSKTDVRYSFFAINKTFPASSIPAFLSINIPNFVLLAIYFSCRSKNKRENELKKMSVQDLE